MRTIVVAALLLISGILAAVEVSLGKVPITIPNPQGFVVVTEQMPAMYKATKAFLVPTNEEHASYIPEKDAPAALGGELCEVPRRYSVQSSKQLAHVNITVRDFSDLKQRIKTEYEDTVKQIKQKNPNFDKNLGAMFKDGTGFETDVSTAFVPLTPHYESDRVIAYSTICKYKMTDEKGGSFVFVAVVTQALVHVKGRALMLFTYAEDTGLEWSRDATREWSNAVVLANPATIQDSVRETVPPAVSMINWEKVLTKMMGAAIAGGIMGLLVWLWQRGKNKASS